MRQSTRWDAVDCLKIGGVASAAIADLLDGPAQPAELIGSFPVAVYLRTAGGVVALVGPDAVRLPNAMVLARTDFAPVARHAATGALHVGDGGVQVGPVRVTAGRWWDPVPRLGRLDSDALAVRIDEIRSLLAEWPEPHDPTAGRLRTGRDVLVAALAEGGDVAAAAGALVGLGPGLTPAGDDLLAGVMAGLVVFGRALERAGTLAAAERLRSAVLEHAAATTPLAADLTAHAARGALVQPAAELCRVIADQRPSSEKALEPALERLLRIGHTSGRDLAEGLLLGASTALSWVGTRLRRSSGE